MDNVINQFSGTNEMSLILQVPLLNMFRKTKLILWSFLVWTVVFIIIAATPLGFPYRAETNVQRFNILVTYTFDFHYGVLTLTFFRTLNGHSTTLIKASGSRTQDIMYYRRTGEHIQWIVSIF